MFSALGTNCQYSGNIKNETSLSSGMLFRIKHLNTGRLVVMQDLEYKLIYLKSVGLSEHVNANIKKSVKQGKEVCTIECGEE